MAEEDSWEDGFRSDVEFKKRQHTLTHKAVKWRNAGLQKINSNATPRNKITRPMQGIFSYIKSGKKKKPTSKHSKSNLEGIYDFLAPRSSVVKTDNYTSVIKETEKQELTVQNSDLAKMGARAEHQTLLSQYAERDPN